ncbi:YcaO-like family protein [uncultured Desulfobacter sp.]|uniref:YcaO-like family protein n=1 Tax=uncultured Desulfobacter sp. TaxID=240139 RepID=UPI002AAC1C6F|nr:YcaO-like family protein [uncultured Desulfobacter sp.]
MGYKIILQDAPKNYTFDQDKIISPSETVQRFRERAAALDLDILSRTRRIDNGRLDIPVFYSECGADAKRVTGTNKQMGKGGTPEQSEASAVMELVERFSFFTFAEDENNFVHATPEQLGEEALDYALITQSVHDDETEALKVKPIFDSLSLQWTRGYDLTDNKEVNIPFNWFYMINEFNGPSAGNCTEEALTQGICELVERHVSSRVSREKLKVPGIRLDSFKDPLVRELLAKYDAQGIRVHASDLSLDTGIPTIAVLAWDPSTFPDTSEIVWTAGTAPSPEKAMGRALTEVAQLAGDFNTGSNYVASGLPKFTDIEAAGYITHPQTMVDAADLPDLSADNMKVEVENLIRILAGKGFHLLSICTTHPGLNIPAYYTIMPGAHFRERADEASVGMFAARLITENCHPILALGQLEDLETLIPGKYYTSFYKGLMLTALEETQAAVKQFQDALDRGCARRNLPDICSHMAAAQKNLGLLDQALETCQTGLDADPQRPDLLNTAGACCFMKKDFNTAIAYFEKALDVDPSQAINYANMGSCYRELKNPVIAIKFYEMALNIDPTIGFARDNIEKLKN